MNGDLLTCIPFKPASADCNLNQFQEPISISSLNQFQVAGAQLCVNFELMSSSFVQIRLNWLATAKNKIATYQSSYFVLMKS